MKKNLLSLSIGAAIAGLALAGAANAAVSISGTGAAATGTNSGISAATGTTFTGTTAGATLELNPGGIGHIGVIPYFSTQNGNQTLFSITNSDTLNGKAVKVRFRSAANSDDIFDFTLFLSPGDIWTANISRDAQTGYSRLVTTDNSCTLPSIAALNRGFVDARLPTGFTAAQKAEWTREGYVEVLTMADIPPTAATAAAPDLYYATKHVNGVAPCTDSVLTKLTVPANFASEPLARGLGFDTPSTGLYTNAFIINTANALMSWSNESTAVQAVTSATGVAARGRFVFAAQTNDAVATTPANFLTADPLLVGGFSSTGGAVAATVSPLEFDFPDLSTPYTGTAALAANGTGSPVAQANRLSGSLASISVKNDYSTLAAIGSKTDFTFSLPTRRYHAVVSYVGAPNGIGGGGTAVAGPLAVYSTNSTALPADRYFFIASNTSLLGSLLCVNTGSASPVTAFDRSERTVTSGNGAVVSPGQGTAPLSFCGEVSVLTINNAGGSASGNSVLGATVAPKDVFTSYQEGWLNIATPGPFVDGTGQQGGLPVLGSAYTSAIGSPANGVSTNYSWAFKHKTVPSLVANP